MLTLLLLHTQKKFTAHTKKKLRLSFPIIRIRIAPTCLCTDRCFMPSTLSSVTRCFSGTRSHIFFCKICVRCVPLEISTVFPLLTTRYHLCVLDCQNGRRCGKMVVVASHHGSVCCWNDCHDSSRCLAPDNWPHLRFDF